MQAKIIIVILYTVVNEIFFKLLLLNQYVLPVAESASHTLHASGQYNK